jgi:hypothetical protein
MAPLALSREERNELELGAVRATIEELAATAAEWDTIADGERASFGLEWGNDIGAIHNLMADYNRGYLTAAQEAGLFALLRQLRRLRPTVERLGLYYPEIPELEALLRRRGEHPDDQITAEDQRPGGVVPARQGAALRRCPT